MEYMGMRRLMIFLGRIGPEPIIRLASRTIKIAIEYHTKKRHNQEWLNQTDMQHFDNVLVVLWVTTSGAALCSIYIFYAVDLQIVSIDSVLLTLNSW